MNKRLVALILVILGIFSIATLFNIQTAKATWIGGQIKQDTVWKLADSPFVVTDNIVIDSNATLIIDAGVEIRFGGVFSITVHGNLTALGTSSNEIKFMSNKVQPTNKDWKGFYYDGKGFYLNSCIVEDASNYEYGVVDVQSSQPTIIANSIFRNIYDTAIGTQNSRNVSIVNCQTIGTVLEFYGTDYVHISGCQFSDSYGYGVYVSGGGDLIVKGNVFANSSLYIDSSSNFDVSKNVFEGPGPSGCGFVTDCPGKFYENSVHGFSSGYLQIGVWADPGLEAYNNTVCSNTYGIYFASADNTDKVLNNSICYNIYGIYHNAGTGVQVHYNDIYSNTYGENVTNGATTNSTYNFWGDSSGPYHISMNPSGKGNPVNGNGVDLRFIPFLTSPIGRIRKVPIAALSIDKKMWV